MRILVTGGAGFIGSHFADRMVAGGHEVVVLDDLSAGYLAHLEGCADGVRFHRGSVLDRDLLRRLLVDVDRVLHLASPVGVERVARDPAATWRVIVEGTRLLLELAERRQVPVVAVSSSEVYGFEPPVPVREEDLAPALAGDAPRLAYARAKLEADQMACRAAEKGAQVLVARPFNVVGPRQAEAGGAVLPRLVAQALAGRPLPVHGDGSQRRTFLDVRDLAEILAGLVLPARFPWSAVNVGGTRELSIMELARQVVKVLGSRSAIQRVAPPPARGGIEIRRRVPDLARLERLVRLGRLRPVRESIVALAEDRLQVQESA